MDRQGKPPSPPPVETEERHPEEALLPLIRIFTWMMEELEERLRSELRVYVRELLIQARVEELLRRRRS
jgi:hypothetical protein